MKNLHNVPQIVIDCAENLLTSKQDHMRQNYIMRLESIRDFCDSVIKKSKEDNFFSNMSRTKKK